MDINEYNDLGYTTCTLNLENLNKLRNNIKYYAEKIINRKFVTINEFESYLETLNAIEVTSFFDVFNIIPALLSSGKTLAIDKIVKKLLKCPVTWTYPQIRLDIPERNYLDYLSHFLG